MGRQPNKTPKYLAHVSGQATCYIKGEQYYLGEYESPESYAKYYALLAEYSRTKKAPPKSLIGKDTRVTVAILVDQFASKRIPERYSLPRQKSHREKLERIAALLKEEQGDVPLEEYGPRKLTAFRDVLIESKWSRTSINEGIRNVIRIFKYGVECELVTAEQITALECVEPLRRGATKAAEPVPRDPVDLKDVAAVMPYLSPTIRAMIRVQLATGCRPSELYTITPGEIDTSGEIWMYCPSEHKTSHYGKLRILPMNETAQLAIKPFLDRDPNLPIFSPRESAQYWRDKRRAERVTPDSCGNKPGKRNGERGCKGTGKKGTRPGDTFAKASYRNAIKRACRKAGIEEWTPYRLRHTSATEVADALGIEAAAALLGHSKSAITAVYTRKAKAQAAAAAKAAPKVEEESS